MSPQATRRQILAGIVTAGTVGTGAVYGLNQITSPALAQAGVTFEDKDIDLEDGELIEDITISGTLTGQYEGMNGNASRAAFDLEIGNLGEFKSSPIVEDTIEETDIDPNSGRVEVSPSYSLLEDSSIDPESIVPMAGEDHTFSMNLTLTFRIMDADNAELASDTVEASATLNVGPEDDRWQYPDDEESDSDPSASVAGGTLSMEATTTSG